MTLEAIPAGGDNTIAYRESGPGAALDTDTDMLNQAAADESELTRHAPVMPVSRPLTAAPQVPSIEPISIPSVSDVKQKVGDSAGEAFNRIKDTAGKAAELAQQQIRDHVTTSKDRVGESLGTLKTSLEQVGDTLDRTGEPMLGRYTRALAQQTDRAAQYIQQSDINQIGRDAREFARQNPALVIGSAFLMGMCLARFFKASENALRSEALAPVLPARETGLAISTPPSVMTPAGPNDFQIGVKPLSAHGYVDGGIVGGAPA